MTSRRNFLLQGSIAGTVFLAGKPVQSFSNVFGPIAGLNLKNNKVVLIHTGNYQGADEHEVIRKIKVIKKNTGNVVLLHAGNKGESNAMPLDYDFSLKQENHFLQGENDYKILHRGNIKIAVITANEGENDVIKKANTLSAYLKKEKRCHMVICLSQLGYINKGKIDDRRLAENSDSIDIIISGHPSNYFPHTVVAANSNNHEVIIHNASGKAFEFGNIEIGFDRSGNKNSIEINNLITGPRGIA